MTGDRSTLAFRCAVVVLFLTWLGVTLHLVEFGRINHDEGWYLYASQLVFEGALPYRDFAFFQAPVLPYVYGLVQAVFGSGIGIGRLTSWVLGAAVIALGTRLSWERGGRPAALLFLAVAPFTPLLVWTFATTRTEPLNAFFLMICAYALLRPPVSPAASAVALGTAVLAAATRVASLPLAVCVFAVVAWRYRHARGEWARALGPAVALAATIAALLWAAGPDAVFFDLVTRQAERHDQLEAAATWSAVDFATRRLADVSLLRAYYGGVPLAALACTLAAGAVWISRRDPLAGAVSALGVFVFLAYAPNLVPRVVFPVYFAAIFAPALVGVAWCAGAMWKRSDAVGRRAIAAVAAAFVFFQVASFTGQRHLHTSENPTDREELETVAQYLEKRVTPGRTLVTLDTVLAVESGLRVMPGWEMSIFSYFPDRSEEDGRRLGILTPGRVTESLRDPAVGAVALSDHALGILVDRSLSGFRPGQTLSEDQLQRFLPELERYRLDRVFARFGQFQENLYVLLPARP